MLVESKSHVITFGKKYPGQTVEEILEDPGGAQYLLWCHENIEWFELGWDLLDELTNGIPDPEFLKHLGRGWQI